MQPLSVLVGAAQPTLQELEDLQGQLYALLVARFGQATAAQVGGCLRPVSALGWLRASVLDTPK